MNYSQQVISEITQDIKAQGFRVFIAESGSYGFFTDENGSKVISFQVDYLSPSFNGNYKTNQPKQTGTGWIIPNPPIGDYKAIFNSFPPQWAVGSSNWKFTTLDQHLSTYQKSSKYQEA